MLMLIDVSDCDDGMLVMLVLVLFVSALIAAVLLAVITVVVVEVVFGRKGSNDAEWLLLVVFNCTCPPPPWQLLFVVDVVMFWLGESDRGGVEFPPPLLPFVMML